MKDDTLLRMAIAKQYAHHASFSGTPRQAVADGYSAVDAVFSALLTEIGEEPSRNHKTKLDQAKAKFSTAFDPVTIHRKNGASQLGGTDWDSLVGFYKEWLQSRYDKFDLDSMDAADRVREANCVVAAAVRHLAALEKTDTEQLEKAINQRTFGYESSEASMAVGLAHDHLFWEAETLGERLGRKLGIKMASATNYCDLDFVSGDEITQKIISEDQDIAREAATVYRGFVKLIENIQMKRLEAIAVNKPDDEISAGDLNASPDFMRSMKARYHGGTLVDFAGRWMKGVGKLLSEISAKAKGESKGE